MWPHRQVWGATFRGSKVADQLRQSRWNQLLSLAADYIIIPMLAYGQSNPALKSNLTASLTSIGEQGSSVLIRNIQQQHWL